MHTHGENSSVKVPLKISKGILRFFQVPDGRSGHAEDFWTEFFLAAKIVLDHYTIIGMIFGYVMTLVEYHEGYLEFTLYSRTKRLQQKTHLVNTPDRMR